MIIILIILMMIIIIPDSRLLGVPALLRAGKGRWWPFPPARAAAEPMGAVVSIVCVYIYIYIYIYI